MRESAVRSTLTRECKAREWHCIKTDSLATGFPDDMVLAPFGRVAFVEEKAPGGSTRRAQRLWHKLLRKLGFEVVVLEHPDDVKAWIQSWERGHTDDDDA